MNSPAAKLLIIDDDAALTELVADYLSGFGYEVAAAQHPREGLALLARGGFAAVILDVMLPEMNGFEVCRALRRTSSVPVLMLTARGDVTDRVVGLEMGADDYLPKPFEPRELAARISALLRRGRAAAGAPLCFDGVRINAGEQRVWVRGKSGGEREVVFTAAEFRALLALARQSPDVVSRDELIKELRGIDRDVFDRSVDITVSRVRAKLGDSPRQPKFIRTARGEGYAFVAPPAPPEESSS